MDFGVTGKLGGYYLAEQYRKNVAAGKSDGVSFAELAAAKAAEKSDVSGMSFKDMWQAKFSGAYYHTMDASNIPQGVWERNDFPFENFFQNEVGEATVNWKPNGANPAMDSSDVQSRLHSIAGQKSIVVPPELEEKMKNDPALAGQVMAKVENFIAANQVPGRICSHLIVLDENGEIARFRASSHGGNITGPTEEEMRQFEAEQAAKKKRREEYARTYYKGAWAAPNDRGAAIYIIDNNGEGRFYTAEEMAKMKAELIEKNTATAHKLSDPYSILYKKLHPEYNGERIFCEYPGGPLYTADEIMDIMNRNAQDAQYQAEARKNNN